MAHWKHVATRCAVEGCESTRRKGWSTCGRFDHYPLGVGLYGLAPRAPKLHDPAADVCPICGPTGCAAYPRMTEATARALARRLTTATDAGEVAGIRAAMEVGGFDPDTTEPDDPQGYNERAVSTARAVNPAYLNNAELSAWMAATTKGDTCAF